MATIGSDDNTQETEAETTDLGGSKSNSRRGWMLAVMCLGTFMVFLDSAVVNTALQPISRDLGASTSTLQWVVNAYILILAGLLLVGGTVGRPLRPPALVRNRHGRFR